MITKRTLMVILQKILHSIDEGIHVINNEGITILYNEAMAELEGMKTEEVMGKSLLDVFPSLNHETSTLLQVLKTEEPIYNQGQIYLNNQKKQISTINTTIPLYYENQKIGTLEIAKNITKIKGLSDEIMRLQAKLIKPSENRGKIKKYTFDDLIGQNINFKRAIQLARRAAFSASSVLIYGETGTGKELFAQSIHYHSNRCEKPFIAQNCAALPESLLEGILFGTMKGAFTGAIDRPGIFEQASGGTILLDEINAMGLQLQAKLLRVLQEGYIRRIGGLKDIPIDVRIIATTNENPSALVEEGILRKDLYYRLKVISINIPSLRERREDILLLADYFIHQYNHQLQKQVRELSEEVKKDFLHYTWPGNIRELQNLIEGAMNLIQDEHILEKEFFSEYIVSENLLPSLEEDMPLPQRMNFIEEQYIRKTIANCNGNITRTADKLGIKRQTLQHKLKKLNISYIEN
ncbi:sigma-54 interaction domain-containing protein [Clostridium formicaceticum]|uniref:Arginine utilization regulatory protein RocR n=1 Tax=Clostridium formicaceticum TaxID=1497 RepID=A0AAC9RKQ3_9CLOT|nr:sigma 54-interacting transcriptional regulator [Clostridium formicaceticum]AOY76959.1 sigma-54-dependent Fis family transcriptional regulator [Clostridium formicaceticum]ARE87444.1 Arginine utilization regulatory protein RocR [Clostridium formicaceticum]